jgi:hypothetical protein
MVPLALQACSGESTLSASRGSSQLCGVPSCRTAAPPAEDGGLSAGAIAGIVIAAAAAVAVAGTMQRADKQA